MSTQIEEQRMAVMNFPGVRLAVPLVEVHSLVSVLDLDESGTVEVNGEFLPIFGLDSELRPVSKIPDDYRVCANLGAENPRLGLICQSIETLEKTVREEALPACMVTDNAMIKSLALNDGEVLLCTNLAALLESISRDESSLKRLLKPKEAG